MIKKGDWIFFAGSFFEVAEIKSFPHGEMIGIFDYPNHIDYLNPNNVKLAYPCYACQGEGCPVCSGFGKIIS